MARPSKQGLDYFPLEVDIFENEKIEAISGEFGAMGELAVIKLLCKIYKEGYYIKWDHLVKMKIAKQLPGLSKDELENLVTRLIEFEFFNEEQYRENNILTSAGIQARFIMATARRKSKDQLVYEVINARSTVVNVGNNSVNADDNPEPDEEDSENDDEEIAPGDDEEVVNVDINPDSDGVNADISTQSKVKESKVKKSRLKKTIDIIDKNAFDPLILELPYDSEEFKESWIDFCSMRENKALKNKKSASLTAIGAKKILNKLKKAAAPEIATAMLDRSIVKEHEDVYELPDFELAKYQKPTDSNSTSSAPPQRRYLNHDDLVDRQGKHWTELEPPFDSSEFLKIWGQWTEHLMQSKARLNMSVLVMEKQIAELKSKSEIVASKMLNNAMAGGYSSFKQLSYAELEEIKEMYEPSDDSERRLKEGKYFQYPLEVWIEYKKRSKYWITKGGYPIEKYPEDLSTYHYENLSELERHSGALPAAAIRDSVAKVREPKFPARLQVERV
jgi:hypothetical protein